MAQRIEFINEVDFTAVARDGDIHEGLKDTLNEYAQHGWTIYQIEEVDNPKGLLVFLQK